MDSIINFGEPGRNLPVTQKHKLFQSALVYFLPKVLGNDNNIVLLEVLLALKLEGLVGKELSEDDVRLIRIIQESILASPAKRLEAIKMAQVLVEERTGEINEH
jgi:hypothetical protein